MVEFVQKLLRETLEVPPTTELGIERAHRALAPRPSGDREDKPRSIIIRFLRYTTKEEVLRKAWGKKKEDGIIKTEELGGGALELKIGRASCRERVSSPV